MRAGKPIDPECRGKIQMNVELDLCVQRWHDIGPEVSHVSGDCSVPRK